METDNAEILKGKNIVLGVCSSISAYKAVDIVSRLVRLGANVQVIMTKNATNIIGEKTFETLSRNKVNVDMWETIGNWMPEHISLADKADVFAVAPATANSIGNFANGIAPDMLSSTYLATKAKVLIAPAMNVKMYEHPAVQNNMKILKSFGVHFIEPEEGPLACGVSAKGRLAGVDSIVDAIIELAK